MPVFLLSEKLSFPPPTLAAEHGLLALGGDLTSQRLLLAYRMGIFPWFSRGDPILWWSPDPRMILPPDGVVVSRRLRRTLRAESFEASMDRDFPGVIQGCAGAQRRSESGTWITDEMIEAYCRLHESGFAHSVEVWSDGRLAGGLYGVALGACFFGESMFFKVSNASKVALVFLAAQLRRWNYRLIDCQVPNPHLQRMGASEVPRRRFLSDLQRGLQKPTQRGKWRLELSAGDVLAALDAEAPGGAYDGSKTAQRACEQ